MGPLEHLRQRRQPVRRLRDRPRLPRPARASCTRCPGSWSSTAATSSRASSSATGSTAGSSCASTSRWPTTATTAESLRADFAEVARGFEMTFEIWGARAPYRTLIMVSKQLHCLNDLLFRALAPAACRSTSRWWSPTTPTPRPLVRSYGIEFRHIPVTPETKADAEAELMELHEELGIHLVVLARYMQVLSDDVCRQLSGQAINIHHSFLPSFKGARPYHQAFDRGVKLIGATAHYVTADLDEGPIIEQDVIRVDHNHTPGAARRRRPRRRGPGALPRGALALRVAGAARREPDGRLPLTRPTSVVVRIGALQAPNRMTLARSITGLEVGVRCTPSARRAPSSCRSCRASRPRRRTGAPPAPG